MGGQGLSREFVGHLVALLGVALIAMACVVWLGVSPIEVSARQLFWAGILVLALSTLVAPAARWPNWQAQSGSALRWVRNNFFSNSWNALLTIVAVYFIVKLAPPAIDWLFVKATWGEATPEACRAAKGACWAMIQEKHRVIFFGRYPFFEHWRPLLGICLLVTMVLVSCFRRFWRPWIGLVWAGGSIAFFLVMWGGSLAVNYRTVAAVATVAAIAAGFKFAGPGSNLRSLFMAIAALLFVLAVGGGSILAVLDAIAKALFGSERVFSDLGAASFAIPTGLSFVPTALWGGLPLTLLLSVVGIIVSFPLAILLALGRRSKMPLIRTFCVGYIELIRGVPLISLLFVAAFVLPLFLPQGVEIGDLLRAQVAIILFAAAYLAEVIRGGLQAIPRGQFEAADALGLGYWQKMGKVVLPQAITIVIPPIVNTFIGLFKDTSLVSIVSLTDLLLATKDMAIADVNWRAFYAEGYIFAALIYFVFCFFMSQYSQHLERTFETGRRKRR